MHENIQIDQVEHSRLLSPRELARAIGVSESSVKRWADDGKIRVQRTAGGHRRIALSEAIRFVRDSRSPLVKPELLGLQDVAALNQRVPSTRDEAEQFYEYLLAGAEAEARGLVLSLYLEGRGIAEIVDGPIRDAMERLGELWQHGEEGIFHEHRATDICIQALSQLRLALRPSAAAPRAVGGAPSGDPYILPSLSAATILLAEGFQAVNLGPNIPLPSLEKAIEELDPVLVWLSVSNLDRPEALRREARQLLQFLEPRGAMLLLGGRRRDELELEPLPNLYVGASMGELAALARGLVLAAGNGSRPHGRLQH